MKDAIPFDAKDQLYGVVSMSKAWDILDKRYGDVNLIAKTLKSQLKNLQIEGKSDPDKVINLTIKVRTLVEKLRTMKKEDALIHDSEFLASVYCALPTRHQQRWLDYPKSGSDSHWGDMMNFLDKAYAQANEEKVLMSTYVKPEKDKDPNPKKPPRASAAAAKVNQADSDSENETQAEKKKAREAKKKAVDYCGDCSLCSKPHTWTRRDNQKWPSDRFISCNKFSDLNTVERAKIVEKAGGCARCLSWKHKRDYCRMKANSCGKEISGSKCTGDHSRLVCGSGSAYCAALTVQSASTSTVDQGQTTVFFIQNIPVKESDKPAKVFWDTGSTRVLIRDAYATAAKMPSKKVSYMLEVVKGKP